MPKKSIYLPDDVMPLIGADEQRGFSSRLSGIIQDRHSIITDAMPEFTQKEWLFICDMLNGCVLEGRNPKSLGADIAESGTADGLNDKWSVDGMDLARRVDVLPLASKIAIQDVAYRFWQSHGIVSDYSEVLIKCGAKIQK